MSYANDLLNAGFAVLNAMAGEALTFHSLPLTAVVNRFHGGDANGVPLNTSIEFLASSVASAPVCGERFTDSSSKYHTISRVRLEDSNYFCECYCFSDLPTEAVTIGSSELQAFVLSSVPGTDYEVGGFTNQDTHRLAFDRADIISEGITPAEGSTLVFRSVTYYVSRVQRDDMGMPYIVEITSAAGRGLS
jgi:hypothetical protein